MVNRHEIIYPLFLALMLAIITFWLNQTVEEQGPKIDGSDRHDPDYMMHSFVTTQTDTNGVLRYVLAAAEMMHYPDDDTTELKRPKFTQYTLDKPYTSIQGQRGFVSSDGEKIEVLDHVKVIRQGTADSGEMQLLTERLMIEPNKDLATTNSPVMIKQAPKTVVTGVGMIFDKKNQTMKLLNNVRVHYERPPAKFVAKPKTQTTAKVVKPQPSTNQKRVVKKK
ncbi:MAG: LPS export ABC transporter periplasmic protein LptC [Methylophilus sp.]